MSSLSNMFRLNKGISKACRVMELIAEEKILAITSYEIPAQSQFGSGDWQQMILP